MSFESFEEIIGFAIEKEKEAAAFYTDAAKQTSFAGVRESLEEMAEEEKKHQSMLENFSKENVEVYTIEKIPDLKRSDYLVDIEYEPGMAYPDLLRLAMKREEKSLKFYTNFAEGADTEDHKKLFQVLAQEESKHKLKLETMLDDYMAKQGD